MGDVADMWSWLHGLAGVGLGYALLCLGGYATLSIGMLSVLPVAAAMLAGKVATMMLAHAPAAIGPAALGGAGAGLALGLLALPLLSRLQAAAVAPATLGVVLALHQALGGGPVPAAAEAAILPLWWVALALLAAAAVFRALHHSWYGIVARMHRGAPDAAAMLGMPGGRLRLLALPLSGLMGGVAGVALTLQSGGTAPDAMYVQLLLVLLAGLFVGGSHHWFGPVLGGILAAVLPALVEEVLPSSGDIVIGALLLISLGLLPRGVVDPRVLLMQLSVEQATRSRDPGQHGR